MNTFGHVEPMKVILFPKRSKSYVDFENAIKIGENVDDFKDNCVWICCGSFCQLWQEYMSLAVNVWKSCPKISDPIKRDDTQLNLFDINETLAKKFCCADFTTVLELLTGWFQKGFLKQEFYGIQVTSLFGINNFGHIEAMKVIFFSKCSKSYVHFENAIRLRENVENFGDNFVWTCCKSFCELS